jgi:2'-5' RNA ligase
MDGPHGGAWLEVEASEGLTDLHWRMVEELRDLYTTTYHGEDTGQFRPHLTLVQQIPAEQVDAAVGHIRRCDTHYTFPVSEAALVGRRAGIAWETIATFPLGTIAGP